MKKYAFVCRDQECECTGEGHPCMLTFVSDIVPDQPDVCPFINLSDEPMVVEWERVL